MNPEAGRKVQIQVQITLPLLAKVDEIADKERHVGTEANRSKVIRRLVSEAIGVAMICTECLMRVYGGEEKCCSHGVILGGGYVRGACAECGREVSATATDHLHCPSGPRRAPTPPAATLPP